MKGRPPWRPIKAFNLADPPRQRVRRFVRRARKAEEKPITLDDKDVFILDQLLGQDNRMLLRSELFDEFKFKCETIIPKLRFWPPSPSNYHKVEIRLEKHGYIKVVPGAHGPFIKITDKGVEARARRDEELDGPLTPEV